MDIILLWIALILVCSSCCRWLRLLGGCASVRFTCCSLLKAGWILCRRILGVWSVGVITFRGILFREGRVSGGGSWVIRQISLSFLCEFEGSFDWRRIHCFSWIYHNILQDAHKVYHFCCIFPIVNASIWSVNRYTHG